MKLVRQIQDHPGGANIFSVPIRPRRKVIRSFGSKAALVMFVEANLTKGSYNLVKRSVSRAFSYYNVLLEEKLVLFPPRLVLAGEDYPRVRLQDFVDITAERLFSAFNLEGDGPLRMSWKRAVPFSCHRFLPFVAVVFPSHVQVSLSGPLTVAAHRYLYKSVF